MNRRTVLCGLTLGALAAPLTAEAQPKAGKVWRIGVLWATLPLTPSAEAFEEELRKLGWVEGRNVVLERRYAEDRYERFPALAGELVSLNVDVILAGGGPASLNAAKNATKTIPIVMVASSTDPVGQGLIQSFARPGGNITGLTSAPATLATKRLELLKELVPGLSRIGVLWDAAIASLRIPPVVQEAARSLRVELIRFEVREPAGLESALITAKKQGVQGVYVLGTPMFVRARVEVADILKKHRLPSISEWRDQAEAGLLLTYGASRPDEFRRAAAYVDKILKGAKPADLPVEQPTKYELVINMRTANALGLTIPPSLLLRADRIIE